MFAGRAGAAIAERLGTPAVTFPGGHDGFLGGEFGRTGDPDAFTAKLRDVFEAEAAERRLRLGPASAPRLGEPVVPMRSWRGGLPAMSIALRCEPRGRGSEPAPAPRP
jgi:hypothetical protein